MPTLMHGLLQAILISLLIEAGYKAASEVKLKIDANFHPVPDIIATRGVLEFPYPTRPLEIIAEVLSDQDSMSRVLAKCRSYRTWGFEEIYVIGPVARIVLLWTDHKLEEVNTFASIPVHMIWSAPDRVIA